MIKNRRVKKSCGKVFLTGETVILIEGLVGKVECFAPILSPAKYLVFLSDLAKDIFRTFFHAPKKENIFLKSI